MTPVFFEKLFNQLQLAPNLRQFIMRELQSPHRHYHGIGHHAIMLKQLMPHDNSKINVTTRHLMVACLFHDIVYDATRSDNEELSAVTARMWLDHHDWDIHLIDQCILATKNHKFLPQHARNATVVNKFLRADLAILWTHLPLRYKWYAHGVRKEYAHVPDAEYRAGRAQVITGLRNDLAASVLKQPAIDLPNLNRNIDWELRELKCGSFDLSGVA